jgi:hypothetical protein
MLRLTCVCVRVNLAELEKIKGKYGPQVGTDVNVAMKYREEVMLSSTNRLSLACALAQTELTHYTICEYVRANTQVRQVMAQHDVSMWKTMVPFFVQTPLFVSFFFTTRKLGTCRYLVSFGLRACSPALLHGPVSACSRGGARTSRL